MMQPVDYDQLTPFKEIIRRTERKRHLRSLQRMAFDVGSGLAGADRVLISAYVAGHMHETRTVALGVRLAIDEPFRAYAEPAIRLYEELYGLPETERMKQLGVFYQRLEALPQSPLDKRHAALIAQDVTLREFEVTYADADEDDWAEARWPTGDDLDLELEQELEDELLLPLDDEDAFADVQSEAMATAVQFYLARELNARERRAVEARAMCDPGFAEDWGDVIAERMQRRVIAAHKRGGRRSNRP